MGGNPPLSLLPVAWHEKSGGVPSAFSSYVAVHHHPFLANYVRGCGAIIKVCMVFAVLAAFVFREQCVV